MSYFDDEDDYGEEMPAISGKGIRIEIDARALDNIANSAACRLEHKMTNLADKVVRDKIEQIIDAAWHDKVRAMAEKAIDDYLTTPRRKTNAWGEPIGSDTVTLSDKIPDAVKQYLEEKVDHQGNRKAGYHGDKNACRIDWIVGQYVRNEINAETQKAAAAVTEKARNVVQQHVARFISEQMVPAIEVNPKS